MSRKLKIAIVIAIFIIGFALIYLDKITIIEFGSFLGVFGTFALTIEKFIEPKKEERLKEEIKKEL